MTVPSALEAGQRLLQRGPGRVAGAGVVVATPGLTDHVLGVGRCLVDRYHDGTGQRIGLLAGMDGTGGKAVVVVRTHAAQRSGRGGSYIPGQRMAPDSVVPITVDGLGFRGLRPIQR